MTEKEYNREIDYIFSIFPSFQKVGGVAYNPGLENMVAICNKLQNPQNEFKTIHIAGTNGKGSVSHLLAAALQTTCNANKSGVEANVFKVGLYTSPHLLDFRERIRVNGEMISKEFVFDFLVRYRSFFKSINASFFEITTSLAFAYFAYKNVDIAVIECGLGGRLDSTNIISPLLSIITNVGLDHCNILGSSLEQIAREKGGIIKENTPVVIGERGEYDSIFTTIAKNLNASIIFAEDLYSSIDTANIDLSKLDLKGAYQKKNIKSVLAAFYLLSKMRGKTLDALLANKDFLFGLENASKLTSLRGRWEVLYSAPFVVCDTGHNSHGFKVLGEEIVKKWREVKRCGGNLYMVFGVVADKDLDAIAKYLPNRIDGVSCKYIYVNSLGSRALSAGLLKERMDKMGFSGEIGGCVVNGVSIAMRYAKECDMVYIGGSTFVVAEALEYDFNKKY